MSTRRPAWSWCSSDLHVRILVPWYTCAACTCSITILLHGVVRAGMQRMLTTALSPRQYDASLTAQHGSDFANVSFNLIVMYLHHSLTPTRYQFPFFVRLIILKFSHTMKLRTSILALGHAGPMDHIAWLPTTRMSAAVAILFIILISSITWLYSQFVRPLPTYLITICVVDFL